MVHPSQRNSHYAPRRPSWSLALRCGESSRVYPIRPLLAGSLAGCVLLLLVGYIGATAYLVYRDDLLGAAVSRQVKMQYSYEERIAALRSELDRLSSRHAVQTQGVEQQLAALLEHQATLQERQTALDSLLGLADAAGLTVGTAAPRVPRARPGEAAGALDNTNDAGDAAAHVAPLGYAPTDAPHDVISETLFRHAGPPAPAHEGIRPVLAHVGAWLDDAEARQSAALDALSAAAEGEAERLTHTLTSLGAEVPDDAAEAGTPPRDAPQGGPFIPAESLHFVERAALLKGTLDTIGALRKSGAALPVRAPLKARYVSSRFGYRNDPFLRRSAFHSGMDLVADAGTLVHATAAGTVVTAGQSGGYGEMVEIAHADGVATRYGHLSEILVRKGMHVEAGDVIGRVGSTGRSTGPHLHYETRRDGEAVDPALYLAAGRMLRPRVLAR